MSVRRIDGFFYGLFMDSDVLRENKISPENPRRAYVANFALRIGQRATLVPRFGVQAYGMVFALTHNEIKRLYSGFGLEAYFPEAILAQIIGGDTIPAICYNLPEAPAPDEANPAYAARLRSVLTRLEFPPAYVRSIS